MEQELVVLFNFTHRSSENNRTKIMLQACRNFASPYFSAILSMHNAKLNVPLVGARDHKGVMQWCRRGINFLPTQPILKNNKWIVKWEWLKNNKWGYCSRQQGLWSLWSTWSDGMPGKKKTAYCFKPYFLCVVVLCLWFFPSAGWSWIQSHV